jgi:hypothetical protein
MSHPAIQNHVDEKKQLLLLLNVPSKPISTKSCGSCGSRLKSERVPDL